MCYDPFITDRISRRLVSCDDLGVRAKADLSPEPCNGQISFTKDCETILDGGLFGRVGGYPSPKRAADDGRGGCDVSDRDRRSSRDRLN